MEVTKSEVSAIESVVIEASDQGQMELGQLHLAFAGGGFGDVVFG